MKAIDTLLWFSALLSVLNVCLTIALVRAIVRERRKWRLIERTRRG